ncbi:MAG: bifunctional metallophosphatase/5'-nucleotidase [Oscillospiraceae bacterium]|nr:bifunctional metallophosphatase/5'-nucleotidase [Oscillospiraceae bacterium]
MKKQVLALILLAVMLTALCVPAYAEEVPAEERDLVILFTSDVHCGIDQGWGYAGLYAAKENLAKDYNVLLVDDGDAIQGEPIGTMTTGEAIIDIMNVMGYDVVIPGNHEFDYGVDRFLELTERANFPYISCNFNKEGELIFKPWLIKEIGGMKIGFVGVTTPDTLRSSTPRYFQDENGNYIYGFLQDKTGEALYNAVQKAVDEVRAEGVDYVVVIGHLGDELECSPWMYSDVISHVSGVDALLDGHSHDTEQVVMKDKDGKDVVRSACGTKLANIGVLHITRDGKISSELYNWHTSVAAPKLLGLNNTASDAVTAASGELNEKLAEVVATSTVDLVINDPTVAKADGNPLRIIRQTETNLGDLCADAYLDQSGADIAFVNGGGIRSTIKKGDITLNDILKVHPYGNSLTVIEVTGQQVLDALEWSVHAEPGEFGGFNHVAGMTFEYDPTIESPCVQDENAMFDHMDESMPRRVRNVMVGGEPLDPAKTYTLASHNYQLLDNGDGYTMYAGANVLQNSVKLDNQVLIDYITGTLGGSVGAGYEDPYGQGRIAAVNVQEALISYITDTLGIDTVAAG